MIAKRLREYLARTMLNRSLKADRQPRVSNLEMARKIGIVYLVKDERDFQSIKKFVQHLKEEHGTREVKALGFVDSMQLSNYLHPKLEFDYFNTKEVNWLFQPKSPVVHNFIEESYDILVDLTLEESLPLSFVVAHSNSPFKVGTYSKEKQAFYDLMMEVNQEVELKELIKSITHYLTVINKDE